MFQINDYTSKFANQEQLWEVFFKKRKRTGIGIFCFRNKVSSFYIFIDRLKNILNHFYLIAYSFTTAINILFVIKLYLRNLYIYIYYVILYKNTLI